MNLYLISQEENDQYDTYDSAVVIAASEDQARLIHPNGRMFDPNEREQWYRWDDQYRSWASSPDKVAVTLLGVDSTGSEEWRVVVASFNAG